MGLFNNFPYMDLSNLNLDFVLKKLKDLTNYAESAEQAAESAEQSASSAQQSAESAEQSASSAQQSAESAEGSADTAQSYAEHIADPVGGLVTGWLDDNITPTTPPVDASLTIQGAAADAKATGDAVSDVRGLIVNSVPLEVKHAIAAILNNVGFKNDYGYDDELTTINAWASSVTITSISAVFNQGSETIYETDDIEYLRNFLTVRANYSNGTSAIITSYSLSGVLEEGTSAITVSYSGFTTSFNVAVTANDPYWVLGVGINVNSTTKRIANSEAANNVRATFIINNGNIPTLTYIINNQYAPDSGYAPIPVPAGATSVTMRSSNANAYIAMEAAQYTGEYWKSLLTAGYGAGSLTLNLPEGATHWCAYVKNGSAGTAAVTQAMVESITYEYAY